MQLDSFLDVITNCIGVLVVLTVIAIINTKYMTFIVRTPFVRQTNKQPVLLECREEHIIPVNKADIQQRLEVYLDEIDKNKAEYNRIIRSTNLELKDVGDKYYRVDAAKLLKRDIMALIPNPENQGDSKDVLRNKDTAFQQILQRIDPEKEFVFFLVRPDSFEAFRVARKLLWAKNIEIGWEPLSEGQFISFGSRGRRPTVD